MCHGMTDEATAAVNRGRGGGENLTLASPWVAMPGGKQ